MGRPSQQVVDFMEKYKVAKDEVWEVHGSTWVVKHKALERVAAEIGIKWDHPTMIETCSKDGIVSICVFGTLGDRSEWSIGEASPKNNKNQYPYAMAEKRAKDRVILKLLSNHGDLYSESEADEFNGNDQQGRIATLPKKDAKGVYEKLQREIDESGSREQLKAWGTANIERIKILPEDWQDILRLRYEERLSDLRNQEAA